jgi:hypothetical protein
MNTPVGDEAVPTLTCKLASPSAIFGMTLLIWYSPALTKPANCTVAGAPPNVTSGVVFSGYEVVSTAPSGACGFVWPRPVFQSTATNSSPRQGFALPADAALDPARRLSEDIHYQSEALLRIAQTRGSLLSLWSDFQARKTGSGGP